jgi:hypothetical protein
MSAGMTCSKYSFVYPGAVIIITIITVALKNCEPFCGGN